MGTSVRAACERLVWELGYPDRFAVRKRGSWVPPVAVAMTHRLELRAGFLERLRGAPCAQVLAATWTWSAFIRACQAAVETPEAEPAGFCELRMVPDRT